MLPGRSAITLSIQLVKYKMGWKRPLYSET